MTMILKCLHGKYASGCQRCDAELPRSPGGSWFTPPVPGSPWYQAAMRGRDPRGEPMLYRSLAGVSRGAYYTSDVLPGLPSVDRDRMLIAQGHTRPGRLT